ncbi:hypothetical protein BD560DRAFT_79880 [Blakeslea trispora]|nr:hypothetical protein BD560DRAFT_79880 [Blakeslea trispora]
MLIRTQANDNGSCSPVPGTITPILPSATNEQNDLYLINHYDCRNNLNNKSNTARASYSSAQSSTYSLYDNPSGANHHPSFSSSPSFHASPYVQHRKLTQSTLDKEQRKSSIDFPSSPPPENASVKYSTLYSLDNHHSSHQHSWSETTNKSSHETKDTSLNKTSPLGIF